MLDEVAGYSNPADVADFVSGAFTSRRLSLAELGKALGGRKRHPHRKLTERLIAELADGVTSPLERSGVARILKAHGLPTGRGQVRERIGGKTVFRDRVLHPYGIVVEFDGRLGHADPTGRLRDSRRDNAVAVSGRHTLRFGWQDVEQEPCAAAMHVAELLTRQGWPGLPIPCSDTCLIHRYLVA